MFWYVSIWSMVEGIALSGGPLQGAGRYRVFRRRPLGPLAVLA